VTLALDNLFGLPAHPLVVHLPVFLVPLTAIGAIWCAVSASWRARIGWIVVGMAFVSLLGVQLAMSSGESFQQRVDRGELVDRHAELADSMRPLELGVLLFTGGMVVLDHRRRRDPAGTAPWVKPAIAGLAALSVVSGAGSAIQVVRVGHSGAKSVWHGTPATKGAADERGRDRD
jgi:uncharacterized membrane protein